MLPAMADEHEVRHELEATIEARRELGPAHEAELVERFAEKLEAEIEQRAQELARKREPGGVNLPLALGSLGIAIPLMGIAGGIAGLAGIIAVCVAIVLVNLFWTTQR
jgi:hypothetical protein